MSATLCARGWVSKSPPQLAKIKSGHRNHQFYVGEPVKFDLDGVRLDRYEVRDYWGNLIEQGPAESTITLKASLPGWYKLYVYAKPLPPPKPKAEVDNLLDSTPDKPAAKPESTLKEAAPLQDGPHPELEWGNIVGGTMFVIFRNDKNFPTNAPAGTKGGNAGDELARGVIGMGPQRHSANADKAEESIKTLTEDIAIDKQWYVPFDPVRPRPLMIAFGGGTKNEEGVRQVVSHFKDDVQYWEPRNEPNFGSSGANFVTKEMKPFYDLVKAVSPKLKVIGPGTVSIGPNGNGLGFIEDFLKAGGGQYIDGFSFHAYNSINGDFFLGRRSMDALNELLKKYGADKLEKWQTEQGYFACVYGSYQPRLQGRWTMVEMMLYEQYGIPKEHNHLWYDTSHGFWDFPTWWENNDGSFNPAAPLMRVWSEELFGTQFQQAYDFGPDGNKLYVGSLFAGKDKRVAAFMSVGSTDGKVDLAVSGPGPLKLVSAFGVESDLKVDNGRAVVPVPELPVYVNLAEGQNIEVIKCDFGDNLALAPGVVATASGSAEHPLDKKIDNDIKKIINGVQENWYYAQKKDDQPWMGNNDEYPAWVEIELAKPQQVSRVNIFAAPPWQWQGSLLDYELQYDAGGKWVTLEHIKEPAQTFKVYTPHTRTTVDSFYSDRWIFQHKFPPVTTGKIRLLVHDVTWGGGATEDVPKAGGQTGPHQIMLREVEIYGK